MGLILRRVFPDPLSQLLECHRRNTVTKKLSDASMWSLKRFNHYLLCGTVDGQLLLLDRETMLKEKKLNLSKKNIRSLYLSGTTLFAACQDKKLFKIDLTKFEFSLEQHCEYARLYLDGTMQMWIDAEDSLELW